ncbi:MAG: cytochrome c peroxidase [Polyangiaceae bacterium]
MRGRVGAVLCAIACASACAVDDPPAKGYEGPPIPWAYAPFPAVVDPADNPRTDAKISLGNKLFYDPILSGDKAVACATCHSEIWGMADGLSVSIGVDGVGPTGPGRTGPNRTTRNALTLWNAALRADLFWDGRAHALEEQALMPLEQPVEMDLAPDDAAARVASIPAYAALFEEAFPGEPITQRTIAKALAAFERTILSNRSPYDHYVDGDEGAMTPKQLRGMQRFADAGCDACHAPPLFEGRSFVTRFTSDDEGRAAITQDPADRGAFRVPTLRNARETGPYFHDGSVATLDEAVKREFALQVANGESPPLDDAAIADLTAFIRDALMDATHAPSRPLTVPSGLDVPVDGFRIPR